MLGLLVRYEGRFSILGIPSWRSSQYSGLIVVFPIYWEDCSLLYLLGRLQSSLFTGKIYIIYNTTVNRVNLPLHSRKRRLH